MTILLLIVGWVFVSGSALLALCWAARDGQFGNLKDAPLTIFDDDEPVGVPTDRFPK